MRHPLALLALGPVLFGFGSVLLMVEKGNAGGMMILLFGLEI
jgi:hypothetical protein